MIPNKPFIKMYLYIKDSSFPEIVHCSRWESKDNLLRLYNWDYENIAKNIEEDRLYQESTQKMDSLNDWRAIRFYPRYRHDEHKLQNTSYPLAAITKIVEEKETPFENQ